MSTMIEARDVGTPQTRSRSCSSCGRETSHRFCPGCGTPAAEQKPRAKPSRVRILFVLLTVLALTGIAVGVAAYASLGSTKDALQRDLQSSRTQVLALESNLQGVRTELEEIRGKLGLSLDAAAISKAAMPSVFKVETRRGSGTAFVVASDGTTSTLLTNFHVVADAYQARGEIHVVKEELSWPASVTAVYVDDDVAVLHVGTGFPALPAHTGVVNQGDAVAVIGAPLGIEGTVTTGIVSRAEPEVLQISAPVNPGNSGGPVLDREGRVIGIATFKAVGIGIEGIGGAVRMNLVCTRTGACKEG